VVVAIQASHQDDTGYPGWHEWAIAGDVALRVLDQMRFAPTVLAWDLAGPLTGSNDYPNPSHPETFDKELDFARPFGPDVWVALHTDNGQPSGVSAVVEPGDGPSRELAERLLESLNEGTGLPNRGIQAKRMYSLESDKNPATYRVFLRIGDNDSHRDYLWQSCNRETVAESITRALGSFIAERCPLTTERRPPGSSSRRRSPAMTPG